MQAHSQSVGPVDPAVPIMVMAMSFQRIAMDPGQIRLTTRALWSLGERPY
jgi:hypothetical protein